MNYCVNNKGTCRDNNYSCGICPQPSSDQYQFDFMNGHPVEDAFDPPKDDVNRPDHYTLGGIEVFDFIQSWELSFPEGNVVKYVVRSPYKGSRLKDLRKARWYLDRLIEQAEKE